MTALDFVHSSLHRIARYGLILCVVVLTVPLVWLLTPDYGDASSHREAPLISDDPTADNTDVYAFVSPDVPNTVTLIANYIPLQEPAGGPNFNAFGDDVRYEIKIDNNGDAEEDIVYQFTFQRQVRNPNTFLYNTGPITGLDDFDYNIRQTYDVTRIDVGTGTSVLGTGLVVPPVNIGPTSTPDYEELANQGIYDVPNGGKVFAGQRDDGFYVDLGAAFDLLTIRRPPGNAAGGVNGLGGFNVHSIAIQVPIEQLRREDDPVIGVWSTTSRRRTTVRSRTGGQTGSSDFVQISRLGMPLVNEVVIPLVEKDRFNASRPVDDSQFKDYLLDSEPARLLNLLFGINVPPTPRVDIATVFLTGVPGFNKPTSAPGGTVTPSDMLRLNTAIPPTQRNDPRFSRLGVLGGDIAGFPNGRRLQDDVVDIELRVFAGVFFSPEFNVAPNNELGDGVDANDKPFRDTFPYMAGPHQGFDHQHHSAGSSGSSTPMRTFSSPSVGPFRSNPTLERGQ